MTAKSSGKGPRTRAGDRYADAPYAVGKGKPPVEHRFKKGAPSPNAGGRPKGSTRKSHIERLLAKRVTVTAPDGSRVRKAVGEVIDHKLVEKAVDGDLKAIKLINDIVARSERFGLLNQPTAEELMREAEEEQERARLSKKLSDAYIEHLEVVAQLKRLGALHWENGHMIVPPWVTEAAQEYQRKKREDEYRRITARELPPLPD